MSLSRNDLTDTEFHIWNVIFGSLDKNWDNMLGDLFLRQVWHELFERVETTNSVIVALFVNSKLLVDLDDVLFHPVILEFCTKSTTRLDTYLSHTCSSVSKICHEDRVEVSLEILFTEE